jgi:NADH:ubiquinone oxidoreductase subunit 6 (subunit J)
MESQLPNITTWLSANSQFLDTAIFYALATIAIPFAYGVLFDRNTIRAGFLLIGFFGAVSILFLVLQAQFIAMAQIMIYAVGITLVVVIALMLTNPRMDADATPSASKHSLPTFIVCLLLFVTIYMSVRSEGWPVKSQQVSDANNIVVIGKALTTDYALPFEFSSVLLFAALVGAIMMAKAEPATEELEYSESDEEPSKPAEALSTSR